jgi:molybdate transport system regulatory protein
MPAPNDKRRTTEKDREIKAKLRKGGLPPISARTKLWLEAAPPDASGVGAHVVGLGLAALLAGVEATGSLSKAADNARMSYRYAWHLVHQAEENLGQPMLVARSGGRRGGGSVLSPAGRGLLAVFQTLSAEVAAFAARRLDELVRETR